MTKHLKQNTVDLFLEGCLLQMEAGREWLVTRVLPLSLDQLRWRTEIGAWSILDCLTHLHLTFEHYVPRIEQAIQVHSREPRHSVSDVPFPESEAEFLIDAEPRVGTIPTRSPLLARLAEVSAEQIVDQDPQLRSRYSTAVRAASKLDLANILVEGSVHPPVQSLGGILALLAAYDRLHIWYAERVRQASRFPVYLQGTRCEEERRV